MEPEKTIYAGDTSDPVRAKAVHDGNPVDLTGASGARFVMKIAGHDDVVIDSAADIINAQNGELGYYFSDPQTDNPGLYDFWFQVFFDEGPVTYGPASLEILPGLDTPSATNNIIVTPEDVYYMTGYSVTTEDLLHAQHLVSIREDRDLWNTEWYNGLITADKRRLKQMVAWTSTLPRPSTDNTSAASVLLAAGQIKSASVGDVSVTYESGGSTSSASSTSGYSAISLHPIAELASDQLTWKNKKTIHTYLPDDYYYHSHYRWTRVYDNTSAFGIQPIVRPPDLDSHIWTTISEGPKV